MITEPTNLFHGMASAKFCFVLCLHMNLVQRFPELEKIDLICEVLSLGSILDVDILRVD